MALQVFFVTIFLSFLISPMALAAGSCVLSLSGLSSEKYAVQRLAVQDRPYLEYRVRRKNSGADATAWLRRLYFSKFAMESEVSAFKIFKRLAEVESRRFAKIYVADTRYFSNTDERGPLLDLEEVPGVPLDQVFETVSQDELEVLDKRLRRYLKDVKASLMNLHEPDVLAVDKEGTFLSTRSSMPSEHRLTIVYEDKSLGRRVRVGLTSRDILMTPAGDFIVHRFQLLSSR